MELQGNNFGERLLEARKAQEFTRENLAKLVLIMNREKDIQLLISLQDWLLRLMYPLQVCSVKRAK